MRALTCIKTKIRGSFRSLDCCTACGIGNVLSCYPQFCLQERKREKEWREEEIEREKGGIVFAGETRERQKGLIVFSLRRCVTIAQYNQNNEKPYIVFILQGLITVNMQINHYSQLELIFFTGLTENFPILSTFITINQCIHQQTKQFSKSLSFLHENNMRLL